MLLQFSNFQRKWHHQLLPIYVSILGHFPTTVNRLCKNWLSFICARDIQMLGFRSSVLWEFFCSLIAKIWSKWAYRCQRVKHMICFTTSASTFEICDGRYQESSNIDRKLHRQLFPIGRPENIDAQQFPNRGLSMTAKEISEMLSSFVSCHMTQNSFFCTNAPSVSVIAESKFTNRWRQWEQTRGVSG